MLKLLFTDIVQFNCLQWCCVELFSGSMHTYMHVINECLNVRNNLNKWSVPRSWGTPPTDACIWEHIHKSQVTWPHSLDPYTLRKHQWTWPHGRRMSMPQMPSTHKSFHDGLTLSMWAKAEGNLTCWSLEGGYMKAAELHWVPVPSPKSVSLIQWPCLPSQDSFDYSH